MKIKVRMGWQDYLMESEDLSVFLSICSRMTTIEGEFIPISTDKAPDLAREKMKEELKKELGDETDKFRNYWLQERGESEKLRNRIKELEKVDEPF